MILRDENIIKAILKNIDNNDKIKKHYDFSYKTQKYEISIVLKEIIKVIKYGIPWRAIENVNYNTAYGTYKRLIKHNIIKSTYIDLLKIYFKKAPNKKLRCLITDTTCVSNRYGSELVKYNGYKKKKCTKVSFITDSLGIPISVLIDEGSRCDSKILLDQLKSKFLINKKLMDKHKKYILADSMYDEKEVIEKIKCLNYDPIISVNKRNSKFKKCRTLDKNKLKMYKKRMKIEHFNNKFKVHRRCNCRYDRNIDTFYCSVYVSLIDSVLYSIKV